MSRLSVKNSYPGSAKKGRTGQSLDDFGLDAESDLDELEDVSLDPDLDSDLDLDLDSDLLSVGLVASSAFFLPAL